MIRGSRPSESIIVILVWDFSLRAQIPSLHILYYSSGIPLATPSLFPCARYHMREVYHARCIVHGIHVPYI